MGDRFLLSAILLFIFVGILAYDRYVASTGEISPVARLIDFAGLSKFVDALGPSVKTKRRTAEFNIQENLDRLSEKYQQIEEKRRDLVQHRSDILEELVALTDDLQEETAQYYQIINNEKEQWQKRFPELEALGKNLLEPQANASPIDYGQFKDHLISLLPGNEHPQEQISALAQILEKIDHIEKDGTNVAWEGCPDAQVCIDQNIHQIENEVTDWFDKGVTQPQQDLEKLSTSTDLLKREYQVLADNYQGSEQQLKEKAEALQNRFKLLTEKLVDVTDQDLQELTQLYNEMAAGQQFLLANLELNRRRFYQNYEDVNHQLEKVRGDLAAFIDKNDLASLAQKRMAFKTKQQDLFAALESNQNQVTELLREDAVEDENFVNQLRQSKDTHLAANQPGYSSKQPVTKSPYTLNSPQQPNNTINSSKNYNDPNSGKLKNAFNATHVGIDQAKERDKYHAPVNNNMDRMRQKARNEGFYN